MAEKELHLSNSCIVELMRDAFIKECSFRLKVKGFSMLPFIRNEDVLTISPLADYQVGFGDSVAFIHPKRQTLAIHRLVDKQGNHYIAKGDNVFEPDGLITKENILGFVVQGERNGRKISFGFGPERFLIALLSRLNVFFLLISAHRVIRESLRKLAL